MSWCINKEQGRFLTHLQIQRYRVWKRKEARLKIITGPYMSSVRGSYDWDMVRNTGHSKVSLLSLKADNVAEFGVRKGLKSRGLYMEIWRLQNGQSYSRCVRLYPDPSECSDMKKKMGEFTSFSVPRASSRSLLILLLCQAMDARQTYEDPTFPLLNPNQPWEFSFLCHCSCLFLHLTCSPNSTPASKLTQTSEPRTFSKSYFSCFWNPQISPLIM